MRLPVKWLSILVVLGLCGSAIAAEHDAAPRAKRASKEPALQLDSSPVKPSTKVPIVSYADVLEPVQKAVVSVYSKKVIRERLRLNPLWREFFGVVPEAERERSEEGLGSGVLVTTDGYILTNNHVVQGADELKVALPDGRELIARVVGADPKTDIAVIKIEGTDFPSVTIADSEKLRVGDVVFAVGNPLGIGQTVTMGIVSATGRSVGLLSDVSGYENFIQTDAAINFGNSGGALVDAMGRLVGINSAIVTPSRGNIGIGLAVPVNLAVSVLRSLVATGVVARGDLGVEVEELLPENARAMGLASDVRGVVVTDVLPDSTAEEAGLKRGDVIVAIDGRPVTSPQIYRVLVAEGAPGATVTVKLLRNGKSLEVPVTLGRLEEKPNELLPGVDVVPLTPELKQYLRIPYRVDGLLVSDVSEDSPFADRIEPGAVIMQIDRRNITDLASARAALTPGRHMLFVYQRGQAQVVTVLVR